MHLDYAYLKQRWDAALAYITRETVNMPAIPPPQEANKPHSTQYGSIEVELVACASHDHELYKEDNGSIYYHLEEATLGTIYSASIKPFQRGKDPLRSSSCWLTQCEVQRLCSEICMGPRMSQGRHHFERIESFPRLCPRMLLSPSHDKCPLQYLPETGQQDNDKYKASQ